MKSSNQELEERRNNESTSHSMSDRANVYSTDHSVAIGGNVTDSLIHVGDIVMELPSGSILPPRPGLLTGRENDLVSLKTRLGILSSGFKADAMRPLTIVRGWVGVGKTTLAAALAHDPAIDRAFPDGILWASLGQTPNLMAALAGWGRSLGNTSIARARDVGEASSLLGATLRNKRMLLLVDDVWQSEHAEAFKVGGSVCSSVFTTRSDEIAKAVCAVPDDIYRLDVLSPQFSFELLRQLAPDVVRDHRVACEELVVELGGLPLGIQVAGRLLHTESQLGWGIGELLEGLRTGKKLLEAQAPSDRADLDLGTTPTVAVLLAKSTERLSKVVRNRFALLGVFAPEPWSFDLAALKAMWLIDEPKDTIRELVGRGLIEPVPNAERFQIHALLALHARSMLAKTSGS